SVRGTAGTTSTFAQNHTAGGITGTETAEHADIAGLQVIAELVEHDHRAGGTGVAVFGQNRRHFLLGGVTAQYTPADEVVHVEIGLVQPQALDLTGSQPAVLDVFGDHLRHHRRDILEYPAAVLHK